jgi:hypothetical protein
MEMSHVARTTPRVTSRKISIFEMKFMVIDMDVSGAARD